MEADLKKIFGYFLLCIGLICIGVALYSVYNVFTDTAKPPEVFRLSSLNFSVNAGSVQGQIPMEMKFPLDAEVKKVVNIFLYYLFMLFVLSAGSKICSLGLAFTREKKLSQ